MAQASKQRLVRDLFEKSMPQGGLAAFRRNFAANLGIVDRETVREDGSVRYEQAWDPDARSIDHNEFHIGAVCDALMGPRWRESFGRTCMDAARLRFEQGGSIMSGELPYTSAALDVIAGLANARALAAVAQPEWIWDSFCTVVEIPGEGGYDIRKQRAGSKPKTDLTDGEKLPPVKITETRIHRNRTLRQGLAARINKWAILDDLTGTIMEEVDATSNQVLAERERKVADCVLGITTGTTDTKAGLVGAAPNIGADGLAIPMVQDGLSFYPYQKGVYGANAGAAIVAPEGGRLIQNFGNCNDTDGAGMVDTTSIQRALQTLVLNRNPWDGLPVPISLAGMTFFCSEPAQIQLKNLLYQTALWLIANGGLTAAGGTNVVTDYNYLRSLNLNIKSSQFWVNRLTDNYVAKLAANGTYTHQALSNAASDTYATAGSVMSAYWMGDFKRAVAYAQRQPYAVEQAQLSSEDINEETVLVQFTRERGQAYWRDPRCVWRAWK